MTVQEAGEYHQSADSAGLDGLFKAIWRGKWIIIATTFIAAVLAVVYAISLPNIYKSDVLLAPAEENTGGGMSALAGQFGGLATLAGMNLDSGGTDKTTIALEVLQSKSFIGDFVEKNNLKATLMATKGWDRSTDTLIYNEKMYDPDSKTWLRELSAPLTPEPSLLEVHDHFIKNNLVVEQDKISGLVRVLVKHYSPSVAKDLVEKLVNSLNKTMRTKDITEAQNSIDYLNGALEDTKIADMRTVFYQLIEKQQQTKMLASVRAEYVFKVIDPAVVEEKKYEPKRPLIVVLLAILGGLIGVVISLVRYFKD
ncbi:Wzz/FepE/Etk N-terminal domain-containing protein [Pseudoalteromonas sp. MM17-2]|uniref:Wzz/FepE/Etk N-terminal domain-containing protein n=1 Tax=Pseudoalteromonas sp. MM17-2 TaxID=2917753 RepID=UPI001EF6E423|nr:Wzz/FepE/Etk N-terminal domain-containing protein [Pseudoalteromonas sp. MM17-2]MCG7543695.1 Wzz/FepE/Etk N-terminal domain-containing protein [Pseudoalteromonas sp. MM17-2]